MSGVFSKDEVGSVLRWLIFKQKISNILSIDEIKMLAFHASYFNNLYASDLDSYFWVFGDEKDRKAMNFFREYYLFYLGQRKLTLPVQGTINPFGPAVMPPFTATQAAPQVGPPFVGADPDKPLDLSGSSGSPLDLSVPPLDLLQKAVHLACLSFDK